MAAPSCGQVHCSFGLIGEVCPGVEPVGRGQTRSSTIFEPQLTITHEMAGKRIRTDDLRNNSPSLDGDGRAGPGVGVLKKKIVGKWSMWSPPTSSSTKIETRHLRSEETQERVWRMVPTRGSPFEVCRYNIALVGDAKAADCDGLHVPPKKKCRMQMPRTPSNKQRGQTTA